MKAKSNIRPKRYKVETDGSTATIHLYNNIKQVETEEGTEFEYDYYELKVPNEVGLDEHVDINFELWLSRAKSKELKLREVSDKERLESIEEVINTILGL